MCGHGDELYIHYHQDLCCRVGFDVAGGVGSGVKCRGEKREKKSEWSD